MTAQFLQITGLLMMFAGLMLKINENPDLEQQKKLNKQIEEVTKLSKFYNEKILELTKKEAEMREKK